MEKTNVQNLKSLWNQAVEPLKAELSAADFEAWIKPMNPLSMDRDTVEVSVPNRMFAAWIEENFLEELSKAWVQAAGSRATFRFTWGALPTQGELFADSSQASVRRSGQKPQGGPRTKTPATPRAKNRNSGLVSRYDFESFVVGANNQFARAAAHALAGQPGTLYNPFFLFGGVGLGKTHLVNAIGNHVVAENPNARVLFISSDTFTNQLIEAISQNKTPDFKNRMRRVDCLILDDVQFLAGRERTQEEVFHIFNALYESGRQIILTSDKFPHELQGVEERLCNRFGWGLVADIQSPDAETRVAILERKARDEGIELPIQVASFIASRFESNIRDLEGALTRLTAYASLNRREITVELAEELLRETGPNASGPPTMEEIEALVIRHFGLKPGDLQAKKRTKKIADARHIAMYLMRHQGGGSFPAIGEYLGGRDHSTIVHGCQAVEKRSKTDARYRSVVETLVKMMSCG